MYKFLPGIFLYLLAGNGCFAQDSILVVPPNEWFLKISPLAVFETEGGIGISGEYVLPKYKLGLQLEVQPVFFTVAKDGYKIDHPRDILESGSPSGIKLRPEVRYYLKGVRSAPYSQSAIKGFNGKPVHMAAPIRVYVAVDFLYKSVQTDRTTNFLIRRGVIQYTNPVKATYTDVKQVYGFDCEIGSVSQSFPNPHWWAEAFIGFGGRLKHFSYRNIPEGAVAPDRFFHFFTYRITYSSSHTTLFRISIPAGVKLVYRL